MRYSPLCVTAYPFKRPGSYTCMPLSGHLFLSWLFKLAAWGKPLYILTKDIFLIVTLCRICLIEEQIPKTVGAPLIHNELINHNIPEDQHNLGERKWIWIQKIVRLGSTYMYTIRITYSISEPARFGTAPAPAPRIYFKKRLRLNVMISSNK